VTVRVGAPVRIRAVAVFLEDVHEAVDLSSETAWAAAPGLAADGPGRFTAARPGTYAVTATWRGGGGTQSGTVLVTVVE
jgi:hypothetical protein